MPLLENAVQKTQIEHQKNSVISATLILQCLLAFSLEWDSATFPKFFYCPGTKEQWDKLKILPRNIPGRDSLLKSGTGCGTGWYKILIACQDTRDTRDKGAMGCSVPDCPETSRGDPSVSLLLARSI